MNDSPPTNPKKLLRLPKAKRDQWVAKLGKSGLSALAFAQKHGLNYATLCRWRAKATLEPKAHDFVELQCQSPSSPIEMMIELRCGIRIRINSQEQIQWVAALIRRLPGAKAC